VEVKRQQLILAHRDAAARIAKKMARALPPRLAEDVMAAAQLGLVEAAGRYREGSDVAFIVFAEKRIRGAIRDELRRGDMLPRRVRRAKKILTAYWKETGAWPNDEEASRVLGITAEDYRLTLAAWMSVRRIKEEFDENRWGSSPVDAEHALESEKDRLRRALDRLPDRDRQLLQLSDMEGLGFREIAATMGISIGRVSQLRTRALKRLREAFELESLLRASDKASGP
jgi:RNA polymerase sigma factor for flagellar operon FliA